MKVKATVKLEKAPSDWKMVTFRADANLLAALLRIEATIVGAPPKKRRSLAIRKAIMEADEVLRVKVIQK